MPNQLFTAFLYLALDSMEWKWKEKKSSTTATKVTDKFDLIFNI